MVTIYTTPTCDKCGVLKVIMHEQYIDYNEVQDLAILKEKKIFTVPQLEVDGNLLDFGQAFKWLRQGKIV